MFLSLRFFNILFSLTGEGQGRGEVILFHVGKNRSFQAKKDFNLTTAYNNISSMSEKLL